PQHGWGDPTIIGCIALGLAVLGGFLSWEAHSDHPMLDVHFFKNPRFTAASLSIMFVFFSMFGVTFLLTQYLQFVLGYTPFQAGIRFLPWAIVMLIGAPLSAPLAHRIGTKLTVTIGMSLVTVALFSLVSLTADSSYSPDIVLRLMLLAVGMAFVMAPATESIMGSLPLAKAGVGSAVNDTTRQVGGALGVAVIGSVLASIYGSQMRDFLAGKPVSNGTSSAIQESLGAAIAYGQQIKDQLPQLAHSLTVTAQDAFVDAFHAGAVVGATVTLLGALLAAIWLPAHARQSDVDAQQAAHAHVPSELESVGSANGNGAGVGAAPEPAEL
ncbi:MAG TPA: MFS transporter, partial [Gaiellaceae bacterium]|nr:MFS transporter [Gaiellaceae bacterium]